MPVQVPVSPGVPEVSYGTVVGGDFMVVRPLKKGSMGSVYVAEQLSTSGHRALKLLRREYVADQTLLKRFEREAQMAARIKSDHVAHIIAAGIDERLSAPWIAMELLEGQHLGDHVGERGPLPAAQVAGIFEQLGHAVGAAHALGIVHRDLKPANVFMSDTRRVGDKTMVKVLDFGIAKDSAENVTLLGSPLGTPEWMAPEQTRGDAATPQTDVWALGLIAFYVLTGRSFWKAAQGVRDQARVMREIQHDPVPIASIRALEYGAQDHIPSGFNEWFAQCVAREPSERFVHAGAACRALIQALAP